MGMALPRFLYSADSESVHQKFIPESGCDEPLLVSSKPKQNFGALDQGNRREWEFGAAAIAMELSEPGAGAGHGGEGSGSDSDESGILEHMGEERRSSERKKKNKKEENGVVVRAGGRAINDGGGNSESFRGASRSTMKRLSTILSGDY